MRVFLDANILFSASNANSPTARVIRLLLTRAAAVTCSYAVEEASRNIELKRASWAAEFAELLPAIQIVATVYFALPIALTEKDVPILCSAIRARCTHLVTSDRRDFGHLYDQTIHGVRVISLGRLAEMLTG
jgi:predicted nucleic acid-binding protein